MYTIAILPILMLVLLGLAGLAAVVYCIVYAVINRRPGAIAWTCGTAFAAVLIGFVAIFAMHPKSHVEVVSGYMSERPLGQEPTYSDAVVNVTDHGIANRPVSSISYRAPRQVTFRLTWGAIVLGAVVVGVLLAAVGRRDKQAADGRRRSAWRWAVPVVLIPLAILVYMRASQEPRSVNVIRPQVPAETEIAHQTVPEWQTMQRMWEQMNQPRIPLGADAQVVSDATDSGQVDSAAQADSVRPEGVDEKDDSNALAENAERIARLSRLLAVVADQVSDVASAVGRGFVAVEGTEKQVQVEHPDADEQVALVEHVEPVVPRPAWVDDPPKRVGPHTWREVVVTDEYVTTEECYRAMDQKLRAATARHIARLTGELDHDEATPDEFDESDSRVRRLGAMGIGIDYIRREIAKEEYLETTERSFGPMKKLYTRVDFTSTVDDDLRSRWDAYRRTERFAVTGAAAGSVLGLVALAFGLLKIDTWTKGYYTKRLFLGVPAAIIGLIALVAALNHM